MLDQLQRNLIPWDRPSPSLEGAASTMIWMRYWRPHAANTRSSLLPRSRPSCWRSAISRSRRRSTPRRPTSCSTAVSSARWTFLATSRASHSMPRLSKVRSRSSSRRRSLLLSLKAQIFADREFVGESFIGNLISVVVEQFAGGRTGDDITDKQQRLQRRALAYFQKMLQVKRIDKTFVLDLEFSSRPRPRASPMPLPMHICSIT